MQDERPWELKAAWEFLRVSRAWLFKHISLGDVKTIKLGRRTFIPAAEMKRLATEGITKVNPTAADAAA